MTSKRGGSASSVQSRRRSSPVALPLPKTHAEIDRIQRERKRVAFERAVQAPFHRKRLAGVNVAKLDDPTEWRKR